MTESSFKRQNVSRGYVEASLFMVYRTAKKIPVSKENKYVRKG